MTVSKEMICNFAIARIAKIFAMPTDKVRLAMKFGDDFKVSFVSDFRRNEFDQLSDDIRDVADREITKEIETGVLTITTVGDYCDHMVRCYAINPKVVMELLSLQQKK